MSYIANIAVVLLSFLAMEVVAWLAHRYLMHGFLWVLHKDHHEPDPKKRFQKNDWFFLIFAIPAILCFFFGVEEQGMVFWVGFGITLYGLAYFLVHELFIHQRRRFFRNTNSAYLRAIRRAHKMHHKHLGKQDGECFGMLWAPLKFYKRTQ